MTQKERFINSPDLARSNKCASIAYLLFSLGELYVEENIALLEKYDLYHHNIKHDAKELVKKFETYDKSFRKMIIKGREIPLCNDYDKLQKFVKEQVETLID